MFVTHAIWNYINRSKKIYIKKSAFVFQNPATEEDAYSHLALGNIWLQTLHQASKNKLKEKKHQDLALSKYHKVLRIDPKNIWAANGIGWLYFFISYHTIKYWGYVHCTVIRLISRRFCESMPLGCQPSLNMKGYVV